MTLCSISSFVETATWGAVPAIKEFIMWTRDKPSHFPTPVAIWPSDVLGRSLSLEAEPLHLSVFQLKESYLTCWSLVYLIDRIPTPSPTRCCEIALDNMCEKSLAHAECRKVLTEPLLLQLWLRAGGALGLRPPMRHLSQSLTLTSQRLHLKKQQVELELWFSNLLFASGRLKNKIMYRFPHKIKK